MVISKICRKKVIATFAKTRRKWTRKATRLAIIGQMHKGRGPMEYEKFANKTEIPTEANNTAIEFDRTTLKLSAY